MCDVTHIIHSASLYTINHCHHAGLFNFLSSLKLPDIVSMSHLVSQASFQCNPCPPVMKKLEYEMEIVKLEKSGYQFDQKSINCLQPRFLSHWSKRYILQSFTKHTI